MQIEVFLDYTCPFCYVGYAYLKEAKERFPQIQWVWRSCEAHPRPEPRMRLSQPPPHWWQALTPRAQQAGLVLNLPYTPVPHSDLAIQGMFVCQDLQGDLWAWHDAVYEAVFVHAQNIEDAAVLVTCAETIGLQAQEFHRLLTGGTGLSRQRQANPYAYEKNKVWAVPTLVAQQARLDSADGVGLNKDEIFFFFEHLLKKG